MFRSVFRSNGGVSVIAEPANCHNGSAEYLATLTRVAKDCGADAVKFQIFNPDDLAVPDYEWYKVYQELNISLDKWIDLISLAKQIGLYVVAEVFDVSMARFCIGQAVNAFKLNIADVSNRELTECLASSRKTIFLSVGGSLVSETERALAILTQSGGDVILNYGFQNYPTILAHSNIAKMRLLALRFGVPICFADHLPGDHPMAIDLPCLAVAAGATSIEKHIILERNESRYDFYSAIEPHQLKTLVTRLRDVEASLGASSLELGQGELEYREMHKKCAVLRHALPAGHQLTYEDVHLKRANGPKEFISSDEVVGKILSVSLSAGVPLRKEHLE